MIQYFKIAEQRFVPALAIDEAFWVHLESPDEDEIKDLIAKYDLPDDFISDLLDADENSRMEYDAEATADHPEGADILPSPFRLRQLRHCTSGHHRDPGQGDHSVLL
jgi:hypothetical protein